jgi:hypothetical protein
MPTEIERNIDIARRKDETEAQYAVRLGIIYADFVADMAKSTDTPLPVLRAAVISQLFDDMLDENSHMIAMGIIHHVTAMCVTDMQAKELLSNLFTPRTEH